eukprot:g11079.t1
MGWMSWENFRCQRDCATHPEDCVSEKLYKNIAEVLAEDGYVAAGYNILWIDDCWMAGRGPNKEFLGGGKKDPVSGASTLARDPVTGDLVADSSRFPSGMKSLGEDFRRKGLFLGLYACAGRLTCEQDAGSMGHEEQDMRLFASWGVKYLKVDGCFVPEGALESQYVKIGRALRDKDIVYACSWPAYLQTGEKEKPFREMYERAGCNMWRNFGDISNSFSVLKAIVAHWAKETQGLENEAPAHAFNDPDMILAGSDHSAGADNSGFNYEHGLEFRLALAEARIQYAVWAIVAAPLLLSADVRKLRGEEGQAYRDLILNEIMIGVNQDPNGIRGGCRAGCESDLQLWARQLTDGSTAISIVNLSTEKIPHYQFSTKLQNEPVAVRDVFPNPRRAAEVASNVGPGGAIAWRILFSAGTRTVQEADGRTRQKPDLKADVTFTDIEPRSTVFLVLQASDRLFPLEDAQIDEDYAHDLHQRAHGLVAGKQKGGNRNQLQEGGKTTNQPPPDLYINDAANQFLNHAYMNVACLLALVIQCSLVGGAVVILTTCVSEWRKRWQDRRKLAATILRRRATFFTPEPGEGEPDVPQKTGPTVDESTKRQVVNNYPVLPFVIPIPVGGAAGSSMSRSKNTVREVIPSAHDLGAQAKWNGFWKTVQDVAALKLNRNGSLTPDVASYDASGKGLAPAMTHANRKDGFAPGMVGADFVYSAPVDALGRSLDNPPVSVPGAGAVVDAGNPFF